MIHGEAFSMGFKNLYLYLYSRPIRDFLHSESWSDEYSDILTSLLQ